MPSQQLSSDVVLEAQGKVTALMKLGAADAKLHAESLAHELFSKYPNADRVALAHTLINVFCQQLNESKASDDDKHRQWMDFNEQILALAGVIRPAEETNFDRVNQCHHLVKLGEDPQSIESISTQSATDSGEEFVVRLYVDSKPRVSDGVTFHGLWYHFLCEWQNGKLIYTGSPYARRRSSPQ